MQDKKYYWLKLDRNFFKRHDIRIIEEQSNGKDYILFYLKLLVESIDHQGELRFSDTIPYDEKMLSVVTNTNIDIVRTAIKLFTQLRLMEVFDDKTIYMAETSKMLGESSSTHRVKAFRERQKLNLLETQRNVNETLHETEIEIEKDIEKEIPTKVGIKKRETSRPTIEDILDFISKKRVLVDGTEVDFITDPQAYFSKRESVGWVTNGNLEIQDWRADLIAWELREQEYKAERENKKAGNVKLVKPEVKIDWLSNYIESQN